MNNASQGTYRAGHNFLSDWTPEEKDALLGLKNASVEDVPNMPATEFVSTTNGVDWRDQSGVVSAVRDQGACGSCWAFSAMEAVESAHAISSSSDAVWLSTQQLVDCAGGKYRNSGCNGGWYFWAYDYLKANEVILESDYSYFSGTTGTKGHCQDSSYTGQYLVQDYGQVGADTASIKGAIENGPVNVAVAAGNNAFMYYTGGIITSSDGCPTSIDHAIVAVGWGSDATDGDYYIVRNSWGTGWGESGYVRIQAASGAGVCGINQYVYWVSA